MTIEYVECFNLYQCPYRSTWRRHTEQRAILASKLAECYACEKTLRKCSKSLWRAYRRLEDYAKCTGIISTSEKTGYGKLCEYTFYYHYESSKPSWSRHVEVRIYAPIPLHISCKSELETAENYAYFFLEALYGDIPFEKIKEGLRELRSCDDTWCNGSCRIRLDETIAIEAYDYRGYEYNGRIEGGWCSWRLKDASLIEVEL